MKETSILAWATLFSMVGAIAAPSIAEHSPHAVKQFETSTDTLYDNTGTDSTYGIVSTYFLQSEFEIYDSEIADDFKVPEFHTWSVTEVDVAGFYIFGKVDGPAKSEHVTFYRDSGGKPGVVVKDYDNLKGSDDGGSFMIAVPPTKLKAGRYWVSVVANMRFLPRGEWAWQSFLETRGNPAQWQNPRNGFGTGCTSWQDENVCVPFGQGDKFFVLKGKSWFGP